MLIQRLGIRVDPAKRLDTPQQVSRALVSLPELRDPSRMPQACVELLHRVAEARGSLIVTSIPPALEPLAARGIMFARATEALADTFVVRDEAPVPRPLVLARIA